MKFKDFLAKLGDMFLDQAGGVDDKRVLGIPAFALGIIFALIVGFYVLATGKVALIGPGLTVAGFLTGAGITALGLAVAGDQGKLNVPSTPSNSGAGLPGS
jgi:hypothetical protein